MCVCVVKHNPQWIVLDHQEGQSWLKSSMFLQNLSGYHWLRITIMD